MADLTPQQKVDMVHQAMLDNLVLAELLNWVIEQATSLAGVDPLTSTELASLYGQFADDVQTTGGPFR
jgi:hypothetical protein